MNYPSAHARRLCHRRRPTPSVRRPTRVTLSHAARAAHDKPPAPGRLVSFPATTPKPSMTTDHTPTIHYSDQPADLDFAAIHGWLTTTYWSPRSEEHTSELQ